jgi:hypothetical protein
MEIELVLVGRTYKKLLGKLIEEYQGEILNAENDKWNGYIQTFDNSR